MGVEVLARFAESFKPPRIEWADSYSFLFYCFYSMLHVFPTLSPRLQRAGLTSSKRLFQIVPGQLVRPSLHHARDQRSRHGANDFSPQTSGTFNRYYSSKRKRVKKREDVKQPVNTLSLYKINFNRLTILSMYPRTLTYFCGYGLL